MSSITGDTAKAGDGKAGDEGNIEARVKYTKQDMRKTQEIAENTLQRMKKLQIRLAQSLNKLDKQMDNARDAVESAFVIEEEDGCGLDEPIGRCTLSSTSTMNFDHLETSLQCGDGSNVKVEPETRLAIAMLIRRPPILATHTFIKFHLALGFDKIYFYFDDVDDLGGDTELLKALSIEYGSQVSVCCCNLEWFTSNAFENYGSYIKTDLVARQIVAIKQALRQANEDGMNWLLHIDIDELLYFQPRRTDADNLKPSSIKRWFSTIPAHIDQVRFTNYEAAPEKLEIQPLDYFKSISLFKRNPNLTKKSVLRKYWPIEKRPYYFTAYSNGKSAVRCDIKKENGVVTLHGAHSFYIENSKDQILSVDAGDIDMMNGIRNDSNDIYSPLILHYPHCSYSLWLKKYKLLGQFPDRINGRDEIPKDSFHILSRNISQNLDNANEAVAKEFFSNSVAFLDSDETKTLLNVGLLVRINIHWNSLEAIN
eukprot:g5511.t1